MAKVPLPIELQMLVDSIRENTKQLRIARLHIYERRKREQRMNLFGDIESAQESEEETPVCP